MERAPPTALHCPGNVPANRGYSSGDGYWRDTQQLDGGANHRGRRNQSKAKSEVRRTKAEQKRRLSLLVCDSRTAVRVLIPDFSSLPDLLEDGAKVTS